MSKIKVDMQGLARLMSAEEGRERYLSFIRPTIEDPYEIWLTEFTDNQGEKKFFKVYVGLYSLPTEEKLGIIVMADIKDNETVFYDMIPVKWEQLDDWRRGQLLYSRQIQSP